MPQRGSKPLLRERSSVSMRSKTYSPVLSNRCPRTSWPLYQQLRRQHGLAPLRAEGDPVGAGSSAVAVRENAEAPAPKGADSTGEPELCLIDNLDQCTPSQLETIYIDALWDYYQNGKQTLTDEQFDKVKMELNWQGSGFPTLHRNEIKFTEASLAYARGEPILSDKEYEDLKNEIKANGKRQDVTSYLLYVKGMQNLNPDEFKRLYEEMGAQGIPITATGAECVLSDTPSELQNDVLDTIQMYTALGVVPTTICTGAYYVLVGLLGGTEALIDDVFVGFPLVGVASVALTTQLVRYLGLTSPQILKGTCPNCQGEIREFASDFTGKTLERKGPCGKPLVLNAQTLRIEKAGAIDFVNSGIQDETRREWDMFVNNAAMTAVKGVAGISDGSNLGAGPKAPPKKGPKPPKPANAQEVIAKEIKEGIFAWAVLLGYGLFGEMFITRLRAKGIGIHSTTINDFCKRFAIPAALRQKYIQTAKRNGHDLGFLVMAEGTIGNGLFGEQAMKWWKAQGF